MSSRRTPLPWSRREWIQGAGAAGLSVTASRSEASLPAANHTENGSIVPYTCNTGTFIPARGRSLMKFSFDFPEPCVAFENLQFGFRVFTFENVYGMDAKHMTVTSRRDGIEIRCTQFVWAGGQEPANGLLQARLTKTAGDIQLRVVANMPQRVKSLTTIVRGVPKGRISGGDGAFFNEHDNEVLLGYPFSAGDLKYAGGLTTPLVLIENSGGSNFFFISGLDTRVRATRFYFQPCENSSYRTELIVENEGWIKSNEIESPVWRFGRASSIADASRPHYAQLEKTYSIPDWNARKDVPQWMHGISLVVALHGMHYTGYIFNSFSKMLTILEWAARHIDPRRVLIFLPAWDGRYYWEYPNYKVSERLGGDAEFAKLIDTGHRLGYRFMPMFGTNAADRHQPEYPSMAGAATSKIDHDPMDLNWVDWDNDRHLDGWLSYMNLGVDSWREWLFRRISNVIERFHVDAYFLDIVGGWVNNPKANMHTGTRKLILDLRAKYPVVTPVGEMHYDALLEFIPLFQVFTPREYPPATQKYSRNFYHLSHPAPGRGSSGVHESGFGRWNPQNLSMPNPLVIPTLTVVDDTWDRYRDEMLAVIEAAKKWNPS